MEVACFPIAAGNLDSGQQAVFGGNAHNDGLGDGSRLSGFSGVSGLYGIGGHSGQQGMVLCNEVVTLVGDVVGTQVVVHLTQLTGYLL